MSYQIHTCPSHAHALGVCHGEVDRCVKVCKVYVGVYVTHCHSGACPTPEHDPRGGSNRLNVNHQALVWVPEQVAQGEGMVAVPAVAQVRSS